MELAQKQSKRAKQNIIDAMLVAKATEAFLDVALQWLENKGVLWLS